MLVEDRQEGQRRDGDHHGRRNKSISLPLATARGFEALIVCVGREIRVGGHGVELVVIVAQVVRWCRRCGGCWSRTWRKREGGGVE